MVRPETTGLARASRSLSVLASPDGPEPEITFDRLTPERLEDYLDFFDAPAFTDNPDWASCYCFFPFAA